MQPVDLVAEKTPFQETKKKSSKKSLKYVLLLVGEAMAIICTGTLVNWRIGALVHWC